MSNDYIFDAGRRIWQRPAHTGMTYSDGDEVEMSFCRNFVFQWFWIG